MNLSYMRQCSQSVSVTRQLVGGVLFQGFEALLLGLLAQVHPELQDDGAVLRQAALERDDAVERLVELGVGLVAVDVVEDRARIPRTEEHADAAAARQVAPVAPEFRPLLFFVGRLAVGVGNQPSAGSIHSFSRLAVSLLPAPSTPAKTMITGKLARRSFCCTSSMCVAQDRYLLVEDRFADRVFPIRRLQT